MTTSLQRPRRGKLVAGVCAAVARRWDLPVGRVRLLFVLSMLLPGPQIVAYLIAWIVLPKEPPATA